MKFLPLENIYLHTLIHPKKDKTSKSFQGLKGSTQLTTDKVTR